VILPAAPDPHPLAWRPPQKLDVEVLPDSHTHGTLSKSRKLALDHAYTGTKQDCFGPIYQLKPLNTCILPNQQQQCHLGRYKGLLAFALLLSHAIGLLCLLCGPLPLRLLRLCQEVLSTLQFQVLLLSTPSHSVTCSHHLIKLVLPRLLSNCIYPHVKKIFNSCQHKERHPLPPSSAVAEVERAYNPSS
jgi:hypothetical protein